MSFKSTTQKFLAIATTFGAFVSIIQPSTAQESGYYYCGKSGDAPATIYQSGSSQLVFLLWVSDYFSRVASPEQRCQTVSNKFEQNKDKLNFIVPGISGSDAPQAGLPVLCASKVEASGFITCPNKSILYTLKSRSDAQAAIDQIAAINDERSNDPQREAGPLIRRKDGFRVIDVFRMRQTLRVKEPSTVNSPPSYNNPGGRSCRRGRLGRVCRSSN